MWTCKYVEEEINDDRSRAKVKIQSRIIKYVFYSLEAFVSGSIRRFLRGFHGENEIRR